MMIVFRFGMGIRVFMAVMFSLVLGAIYSERNTNQKSIQVSQCSQYDMKRVLNPKAALVASSVILAYDHLAGFSNLSPHCMTGLDRPAVRLHLEPDLWCHGRHP
jgi:hypothetical protein